MVKFKSTKEKTPDKEESVAPLQEELEGAKPEPVEEGASSKEDVSGIGGVYISTGDGGRVRIG